MGLFRCMFILCSVLLCVSATALNFPYNDQRIQYIGRNNLQFKNYGAVLGWSGSQVSAVVTGVNSISAYLSSDTRSVYIDLIIDGVPQPMVPITSSGSKEFVLATNLSNGTHTIVIAKATEAQNGPLKFYGFGLPEGGTLVTPPARPDRRIEFIGDSITCGFGDLGTDPCTAEPVNEDPYYAHGPVTARYLHADYMVTAWSGKGMVRNVNDPNPTSPDPLPSYYNQAVGDKVFFGNWNFSNWIPQAVVINLGTNDFSTKPVPPTATYITAYVAFISKLKENYNNTSVFVACGPMLATYCPYITEVASQTGATVIDLSTIVQTSRGCAHHPNVATHQKMALIQSQIISQKMGWGTSALGTQVPNKISIL